MLITNQDNRELLQRIDALEQRILSNQRKMAKLLNITQAINYNEKKQGLYDQYKVFLVDELQVPKFALVVFSDLGWRVEVHHSIDLALAYDVEEWIPQLLDLEGIAYIGTGYHPFLTQFKRVIPTKHKSHAISYLLIADGLTDLLDDPFSFQMLGALTNILAVANENKRLYKRQLEQERLSTQMRLAGQMQHSLVPQNLPQGAGYNFSAIYQPHEEAGGDFYDCFVSGNRVHFCVADISGKGVDAAILAASASGMLRVISEEESDLAQTIHRFNRHLELITQGEKYITLFIAIWEPSTGVLTYVNAGHVQPMLITENTYTLLDRGTTILGCFDSLGNVEVGRISITGRATLLTFTDGLTDVNNPNEEPIDNDQFRAYLMSKASLSPEKFNDCVLAYVTDYRGYKPLPDDLTVLTAQLETIG